MVDLHQGRCIVRPVRQEVDRHGAWDKPAVSPHASPDVIWAFEPGKSRLFVEREAWSVIVGRGGGSAIDVNA